MGYNTNFSGDLKFKENITLSHKAHALLRDILGSDARNHPHWKKWGSENLTHIDLCLTPSCDGIMWNGCEKTYDLPQKVGLLIRIMRSECPEFGLYGTMFAQGEEHDDSWLFTVEDDKITIERD